jgi:hypothetical protein
MRLLYEVKVLNKLLPNQVQDYWDVIKYAIEQSLPPIVGGHPDRMNRILAAALADKVDIWLSYVRDLEGNAKFEGVALTKLLYDEVSDTKNLLIYCIYGYEVVDKGSWIEGLSGLVKYAKSKDCSFITAYTEFPNIISLAKRLGADTRYTFLSFNVNQLMQSIGS